MLLRRVTQHVKDQNWFAVGVDLIIVVVGVFIGIQVSNWNTAVNERKLERAYVGRLTEDVARSIKQIETSNSAMMEQIEFASLIMKSLDTCTIAVADRDNFVRGIYSIGKIDAATFDRTTIDELTSTGRLELIRNVKLREQVYRLKQQVEYQQRIEPQMVARISPPVNYIYTKVSIDVPPDHQNKVEAYEWAHLSADIKTLCADPRFRASVSAIRMETLSLVRWNEEISANMEDLHAALQLAAHERGWAATDTEQSTP